MVGVCRLFSLLFFLFFLCLSGEAVTAELADDFKLECSEGSCPSFISYLRIEGKFSCTGSLVNERFVLTNSHCLEDFYKEGDSCEGTDVFFLNKNKEKIKVGCEKVRVLHTNRQYDSDSERRLDAKDYALIELTEKPEGVQSIDTNLKKTIKSFEKVLIHATKYINADLVVIKTFTCYYRTKNLIYPHVENHYSPMMLLAKCLLHPGASGSAITNKAGQLAGVVYGTAAKEKVNKENQPNKITGPKTSSQGISFYCLDLVPFLANIQGKSCKNENHLFSEKYRNFSKRVSAEQTAVLSRHWLVNSLRDDQNIRWKYQDLSVAQIARQKIPDKEFAIPECVQKSFAKATRYKIKLYPKVQIASSWYTDLYRLKHKVTGKENYKERDVFISPNPDGGYRVQLGFVIDSGPYLFKSVPACKTFK